MDAQQVSQLEWEIDRLVDAWMRDDDRAAAWHAHGVAQGIAIALGVATATSREAVWTAAMDRYQNAIVSGDVNAHGFRYDAGVGYVDTFVRPPSRGWGFGMKAGSIAAPGRIAHFAVDTRGSVAVRTTTMPRVLPPADCDDLLAEAQRRGVQAGDMVRGTYKPDAGGKMVLDLATVEIERPPDDPCPDEWDTDDD